MLRYGSFPNKEIEMKRSVLPILILFAVACGSREPLDTESLETIHQELRGSGTKRFNVSFAERDEASTRADVADRGGQHGPVIGDRRSIQTVMTDAAADSLRAAGYEVEIDGEVFHTGKTPPPPPAQVTPWGVTRVGAPSAWPTVTGSGVLVVVIDTGLPNHADLPPAYACANATNEPTCADNNDHSTHVGGTIAARNNATYVVGVAPGATMAYCKALSRSGSGYNSWIAACIDWARNSGAKVITMSLGGSVPSAILQSACDAAEAAGITVVAAAGNEGPGKISYPAAYASVISVGATDSSDGLAWFSNTNADVELSAPGVAVTSTCKGGGLCTWNGTSMATPHVAGAAALVRSSNAALTGACVRALLNGTAQDRGPAGRDTSYGYGIVNAAAAALGAPAYVCP